MKNREQVTARDMPEGALISFLVFHRGKWRKKNLEVAKAH